MSPERFPVIITGMGMADDTTNSSYFGMLRRTVRNVSKRTEQPTDLAELLEIRSLLDDVIAESVNNLHEQGYSWTEIAAVLGVSRQAARQRYGKAS